MGSLTGVLIYMRLLESIEPFIQFYGRVCGIVSFVIDGTCHHKEGYLSFDLFDSPLML
jgi:hypothetical protein